MAQDKLRFYFWSRAPCCGKNSLKHTVLDTFISTETKTHNRRTLIRKYSDNMFVVTEFSGLTDILLSSFQCITTGSSLTCESHLPALTRQAHTSLWSSEHFIEGTYHKLSLGTSTGHSIIVNHREMLHCITNTSASNPWILWPMIFKEFYGKGCYTPELNNWNSKTDCTS